MPLDAVLAMPYRLFLMWEAWLREQWNRPSRSDHYVMQTAQCALAPHLKTPIPPDKYKIGFVFRKVADDGEEVDAAEVAKFAKARSLARLAAAGALKGMTVTTVPRPESETVYSTDDPK